MRLMRPDPLFGNRRVGTFLLGLGVTPSVQRCGSLPLCLPSTSLCILDLSLGSPSLLSADPRLRFQLQPDARGRSWIWRRRERAAYLIGLSLALVRYHAGAASATAATAATAAGRRDASTAANAPAAG